MDSRIRPCLLATAFAAAVSVAACSGGGAAVRTDVTTTTKGQQLIDLQKAYQSGAMTQEEYERERQKVLQAN